MDELEDLQEQVTNLSETVTNLMNAFAEHKTRDIKCTCGFGGDHVGGRDTCQRNQEHDMIIRLLDER